MKSATPALIVAAAGVGFGHAIMPDHWVPLALVGRARRYPLARITRLSGLAGIAHVLVSLLLGGVIIAIGLQFRSAVQDAQDAIVGAILIGTGVAFAALELSGRGHTRHDGPSHDSRDRAHAHSHNATHEHPSSGHRHLRDIAGIMVPFGAAASPDLTILPVFLAATAAGAATAIGSLIAFALATITTIVSLTLLATIGGYQLQSRWLDRSANAVTAVVLLLIGVLVLTGAI